MFSVILPKKEQFTNIIEMGFDSFSSPKFMLFYGSYVFNDKFHRTNQAF